MGISSLNDIERGDIFLIPFPFSDLTRTKVRPVLVLSKKSYNNSSEDIIVCSITKNSILKFKVNINNKDLTEGKILENSYIKVDNIVFIEKSLLIKKIGILNKIKIEEVQNILKELFL